MAIRTIVHYPNPVLREKAKPIEVFDEALSTLADDMAETMYAAPWVGLAAPQVAENRRLFIIDIASEDEPSALHMFINPELSAREGTQVWQEGCLSFPGITEDIERAERVTVRAQDVHGEVFELSAEGLLAVAIQHELDHLDGVLMIDHLGLLKRRIIHRKMVKREKEGHNKRAR